MKLNTDTIKKTVRDEERLDDRELDEYREINVEADYIPTTAEGSAKVSIGDTQVIVGLKVGVEEPFPDRPKQGNIVTNAELAPMADREYESGPPQEAGVELARVVDRGIRESEAVDLEELCIEPGEKVITLFLDIHVLNDDGNLIDASSLGAMTAIKTGYIPVYDKETGKLQRDEKDRDIPLEENPVTVTASKINGKTVWDPTSQEEDARESRLTVSLNEHGNVVAMQKGGTEPLTHREIMDIVDSSENKTQELREILGKSAEE